MRKFLARSRFLVGALAFLTLAAIAIPAATQQQPSSVNPTASSVKEDQLLRELHRVQGRGSIPDADATGEKISVATAPRHDGTRLIRAHRRPPMSR